MVRKLEKVITLFQTVSCVAVQIKISQLQHHSTKISNLMLNRKIVLIFILY